MKGKAILTDHFKLPRRGAAAFANNHWQGQAVDTARQLKLLLRG